MQNFKPGGLAKYGLDYDSVQRRQPGVIYASISGFGTAGGADLPGYDLMVQAIVRADEPDRRPGRPAVPGRASRCST